MGQLNWREFRIFWDVKDQHPVLYSTFVPFAWEADTVTADALPNEVTLHERPKGIHSVKAWHRSGFLSTPGVSEAKVFVQGAVDAYGYLKHHSDGVVRSEHARILALRVIDVADPRAACPHRKLQLGRRPVDGGRVAIGHWGCGLRKARSGGFRSAGGASEGTLFVGSGGLTAAELEDLLCRYYEVAHLPLGTGPWEPRWGKGPEAMPEGGEDDGETAREFG